MTTYTARPTIYNGTQMRSRLEAGFAKWLDSVNAEWEYEPAAFGSEHGQYLPDFWLPSVYCSWLGTHHSAYIEVKPTEEQEAEVYKRMWIIRESEPDAVILLATPDGLGVLRLIPFPWPVVAHWIYTPDGVGVATGHRGPWEGEWWKP